MGVFLAAGLLFPGICYAIIDLLCVLFKFYAEAPFLNPLFSNFASTPRAKENPQPTPETLVLPRVGTLIFVCLCCGLAVLAVEPWKNIWEHAVR